MSQEQVWQQLSPTVAQERLPHAILLEGEGSALAKRLAMAALCSAPPAARPCGECPHCRKVLAGIHPDCTILEGGTSPRSLSVDAIRQMRADAFIKPNEAASKVYLLLQAQAMSPQAQNALLNILEEPPARVYFFLTCPNAAQLLPTVRSRMQCFAVEAQPLPEEESRAISAQAGEIARASVGSHEADLLFVTANLGRDRERMRAVLAMLHGILRDACVRRAGGTTLLSDQRESVMALCQGATRAQLFAMLRVVQETQAQQNSNANGVLLAAGFCARLRRAAGK